MTPSLSSFSHSCDPSSFFIVSVPSTDDAFPDRKSHCHTRTESVEKNVGHRRVEADTADRVCMHLVAGEKLGGLPDVVQTDAVFK